MMKIKLTREERIKLKEYLYKDLDMKSEYHADLLPNQRDSLQTLMTKYFNWGDEYNNDYIPEARYVNEDRLCAYLVQEFTEFMMWRIFMREYECCFERNERRF